MCANYFTFLPFERQGLYPLSLNLCLVTHSFKTAYSETALYSSFKLIGKEALFKGLSKNELTWQQNLIKIRGL